MKKIIDLGTRTVEYELQYKKVKNINLRIKSDLSITVSASRKVSQGEIERFIKSKAGFIIAAIEKFENAPKKQRVQHFNENEIRKIITEICERVYPVFESKGVEYPIIKFRKMVSRWGSCNYAKGIITFNTALMFAPSECIEYVVIHEFCHFLQPNHSRLFYEEVEKLCPEYKKLQKKLKDIPIR